MTIKCPFHGNPRQQLATIDRKRQFRSRRLNCPWMQTWQCENDEQQCIQEINVHKNHPQYKGKKIGTLDIEQTQQVVDQVQELQLNFKSAQKAAEKIAGAYVDRRKIDTILATAKRQKEQKEIDKALSQLRL